MQVNRASHEGEYLVDATNRPLNIRGRTGVRGRGVLGKWGPNHAADPGFMFNAKIYFSVLLVLLLVRLSLLLFPFSNLLIQTCITYQIVTTRGFHGILNVLNILLPYKLVQLYL